MKKNIFILSKLLFFLFLLVPFTSYSQGNSFELKTFKGTTWHIEQIVTTRGNKTQTQHFKPNENIIKINKDDTYEVFNFMGKGIGMAGFWVETNNVISLSSPKGDAYFWIFEIASKDKTEVHLDYIHFKVDGESISLVMKPYKNTGGQDLQFKSKKQTKLLDYVSQKKNAGKITKSKTPKKKVEEGVNMDGRWRWKDADTKTEMELFLIQTKKSLRGKYTYTKGNAKKEYFLNGKIVNEEGKITISDSDKVDKVLLAKLNIVKVGETLQWKDFKKEPKQAVLTILDVNFGRIE